MLKYEVGKQFPLHNYAIGIEQPIASLNEAFFDVCFYSLNADADATVFRKNPLKYAVFSKDSVPFFLIDFIKKFSIDVSINIHKVKDDKVENWLNSQNNVVNLYLIDANTNILKAMRLISITSKASNLLRDILAEQDEKYSSAQEVEEKIKVLTGNYTTDEMFQKAKLTEMLSHVEGN